MGDRDKAPETLPMNLVETEAKKLWKLWHLLIWFCKKRRQRRLRFNFYFFMSMIYYTFNVNSGSEKNSQVIVGKG